MSDFTLAPVPGQIFLDNAGRIMPGGKLYTYLAGTSTPDPTYTSVSGAVPNSNPIVFDGYGRPPQDIFLHVGVTQKWVLTDPAGVILRTYPTVAATPQQVANVDIGGSAGVAFLKGDPAYLSDGSGGLVAGKWYKADATNTYSSTIPIIGIATADVAANGSGVFRVSGQAPTSGAVVPGSIYYVKAGGGLTSTAPSPNRRAIGQADSVSTIIMGEVFPIGAGASGNVSLVADGRLSVTTAVPVPPGDVSGATSVYYTLYRGNRIALYDGTTWNIRTFPELPFSLAGLAPSKPVDIFAVDNAGTVALEGVAWTTAIARATDLTRWDGVLVKGGDSKRRYLGTVYINASGAQTDDTAAQRYVFNYYNRVRASLRRLDPADSWTYTTPGWRQANNNAANKVEVMVGVQEDAVDLRVVANTFQTNTIVPRWVGIGLDAVLSPVAGSQTGSMSAVGDSFGGASAVASLSDIPPLGLHAYIWMEFSEAAGITTWFGDQGGTLTWSGMSGSWMR